MLRNTFLAVLTGLAIATVSQAAVTIEATSVDTPDLAGFKTWTLMAVSTDPITAVDFVGDGGNDTGTGRGFFGALNQITLPAGNTIFQDSNPLIPLLAPGKTVAMDSQFSVLSTAVVVPPGLAEETGSLLQAAYAWAASPGNSIPLAQIVFPSTGQVTYRGAITALVGGVQTDFPVSGMLGGAPGVVPVVTDAALGNRIQGAQISHTFATSAGDPPITWGSLTPVAGNPTPNNVPTLSAAGVFTWNSQASPYGSYAWDVTATNGAGNDVGRLSVTLVVPEPATIGLVGLMLVGLVGLGARKR